ncbi:MAG: tetratricopeptide repeat protein [Leptolyngbya sp. SIOISBB]|nr:tetratricopeptide repeat protein [Leptolyngbya sp. SIOISBB]
MNTDLLAWDEALTIDSEEEYQALLNGLKRSHGFGLYFVQCSPFSSGKLIKRVHNDLTDQTVNVLKFEQPIADGNVFRRVNVFLQAQPSEVLFVQGLETSLVDAEETKKRLDWTEEKVEKLNWREVPPVLNNLNQQRERFRDTFSNTCLVFLLPQYAIDYMVHRSPDFFDWRSGLFQYASEPSTLALESARILAEGDYDAYCTWSLEERNQRLLEIQALTEEVSENLDNLYFEQGLIFAAGEEYESSVRSFEKTIIINPYSHEALYNKGLVLSNLGRYEEEIAAYDAALAIKPDDAALYNKGFALSNLGRYEEAITAYDAALAIKPDDAALYNKGFALSNLGRYEEAIAAYDAALAIKPDDAALYNKGFALDELGRYEEAIAAYDAALAIKPDDTVLNNKGIALRKLGRYEEAIAAYDAALAIKPDKHEALENKGLALNNLSRYQEALIAYDAAITIKPNSSNTFYNKACCYGLQGQLEPALENLTRAIELSPDENRELARMDTDFAPIRDGPRFQALLEE